MGFWKFIWESCKIPSRREIKKDAAAHDERFTRALAAGEVQPEAVQERAHFYWGQRIPLLFVFPIFLAGISGNILVSAVTHFVDVATFSWRDAWLWIGLANLLIIVYVALWAARWHENYTELGSGVATALARTRGGRVI